MSSSAINTALSWRACAGAMGGPSLWALNTQLGQILPYLDCATRHHTLAIAGFASACLAAAAGWVSSLSARALSGSDAGTWRFIALVSALMGAVFATTLGLQGLSCLIVDPCER